MLGCQMASSVILYLYFEKSLIEHRIHQFLHRISLVLRFLTYVAMFDVGFTDPNSAFQAHI